MVFQHYSLFPWMSARNNVAFGIRQMEKKLSKKDRLRRADSFLEKVGLENLGTSTRTSFPGECSNGCPLPGRWP